MRAAPHSLCGSKRSDAFERGIPACTAHNPPICGEKFHNIWAHVLDVTISLTRQAVSRILHVCCQQHTMPWAYRHYIWQCNIPSTPQACIPTVCASYACIHMSNLVLNTSSPPYSPGPPCACIKQQVKVPAEVFTRSYVPLMTSDVELTCIAALSKQLP